MRIGIAGLGKMGTAIAQRLQETGAELVVWNRSRAKAEALGVPVADTPRALAEQADVIISMLFDGASLHAVYHDPDGILSADLAGKLVVEMTTVRPQVQQDLAEAVRKHGGAFVECPVGGTTGPARTGKLLGLAGGEEHDVARARPVLDLLCRRVEHVGPVGAGASLKLAINLPLLVFWQSFGEALALVRHLNLDPVWLVEFFAETSGGPNVLKTRAAPIAKALVGEDPGPVTFDIDSIRKD
ncbi:MAG: NAD(P)-dependent oxidoreductase, partial [Pseudomonadota bacterium]|nr:NAD(P)-dependent oxidoreductase [Pseudomonadota bacterium]